MSGSLKIKPATLEELNEVLANARDNVEPRLIHAIYDASAEAWAAYFGNELGVVWGVTTPSIVEPAMIWMIGTKAIERNKIKVFREGKRFTEHALRKYGAVGGYVTDSTRWLEMLGYRLGPMENGMRRFEQWQ